MKDINYMLGVYEHAASNKIKEQAAPLNQYFGIDEFVYSFISNEGGFFTLSNQPEPSICYFSNSLYKENLLIRHPDNYTSGPFFPQSVQTRTHESILEKQFGYSGRYAFVIFKKTKDGVHKFLFNSKYSTHDYLSFYVKNIALLDCFCEQYLSKLTMQHSAIEKYTIRIDKLIGPNFHKITQDITDESTNKEAFLKKIGVLQTYFTPPKTFSSQEKRCLNLLMEGKSFSDIAERMHLSYRTIEHYVENIKNKTACNTRSELIALLPSLKMMGLI